MRRRHCYLLDRVEQVGCEQHLLPHTYDWLYKSDFCMSQKHSLLMFLLLIIMGACLARLFVFASGLDIAAAATPGGSQDPSEGPQTVHLQ
ncbi:hypothetical protein Y1Q_0015615 [Alligator mississippiensis]|uniref:Uncharacterized protein n=1 Tax=Alligator mississippiensis TaxID=8496 RepID=A0A151NNY7_ALLMI|nr:hypothetical protein Y1Q_0015615 [Alligator mississippiensis]